MSLLDTLKKAFEPDKSEPDYFKRNSGKKLMATILEPSDKEKKENDTTNPR